MPCRNRELASLPKRTSAFDCVPPLLDRGFTLLEAVVAVAIVGVALVPLITFVSQMTEGLARSADSNVLNLAKLSIVELLDPLNPLENPQGEDQIADLSIRWESTNLIPPNKEIRINAGLAGYSMGFYLVHVSVERPNKGLWFSFDMRKVGYKRIDSDFVPGTHK